MESSNKNGFTLIELLIVVAIIGVLAAVGVPAYQGYIGGAKATATKKQHNQFKNFMTVSILKCNSSPDTGILILPGYKNVKCSDLRSRYGSLNPKLVFNAFRQYFGSGYGGFINPYDGSGAFHRANLQYPQVGTTIAERTYNNGGAFITIITAYIDPLTNKTETLTDNITVIE